MATGLLHLQRRSEQEIQLFDDAACEERTFDHFRIPLHRFLVQLAEEFRLIIRRVRQCEAGQKLWVVSSCCIRCHNQSVVVVVHSVNHFDL